MLRYYKQLYRRINRLPLDLYSLEYLRLKTRRWFQDAKCVSSKVVIDKKKYDHAIKTMDQILMKNQYTSFGLVLDLVYKFDESRPLWVSDFLHTKYSAFRRVWPQNDLIKEFADSSSIAEYERELKKCLPIEEFLIMEELKIRDDSTFEPLVPIRHASGDTSLNKLLMNHAKSFYMFLTPRFTVILQGNKLRPFEIHYDPSPFGLPQSVVARDKVLKEKINYIKSLLKTYVPIEEKNLGKLILFIQDENKTVNSNFFRFMTRKMQKDNRQHSVSPLERKRVWDKQLIPDMRSIRQYYREYTIAQFMRKADGALEMSPFKNYYD